MHNAADRDELVRLWSEQSGWDVVDGETWERRFLNTPYGESAIALTVDKDSGAIVGQCIFIPTVVSIGRRQVRAYRAFAPLLDDKLRGVSLLNPFRHPLYRMYKFAVDFFSQNGVSLVHMIPDPRWLRAFQILPNFQIGKFPLWSLKLPLAKPFKLPTGCEIQEIRPDDERLNELWQKTSEFYDCAIVRNAKFLPWKTSHGNYFYQSVFRGDELIAFVASVFKQRDKQWLICDVLAIDTESLEAAISIACNSADIFRLKNSAETVNKIAILTTDMMLPIVQKLGFYRDEYDFPFVIHLLDRAIPKETVARSRWYLSAND
jgi:hypothetical protein